MAMALGMAQHLAKFALAAAAGLLLLVLLRVLLLLIDGPTVPVATPGSGTFQTAADDELSQAPIAGWHLFGVAGRDSGPKAAPETTLQLFLRGTLSDSHGGDGIAIIADADGGERAYRIGDDLPGGATLRAIFSARVEIERNGQRESLSLPDAHGEPKPSGSPPPRITRPSNNKTASSALPGSPASPFVNPAITVGVPDFATARARALPDLRAMASQVSVLPVLENGRMIGVRVSGRQGSDLLSRYGIQPNDVITAVNGVPLDGPQRQAELTRSLGSASQVKLTLRRDGRELQLTLGMR